MVTRFKSSLFARIFATTAAVISVLFAIMYLLAVPFIQTTVEGIEESAGRTILKNVYEMVEQTHLDLENYRQSILLERKTLLRNVIAVVDARVNMLEAQVRTGKLSKAQAKRALLDELRHITYGRNDYVFAADYGSVLISHPDPELNGADFSSKRDFRGNLIVPPMVAGARSAGEGFYSYWWRRLGEQQPTEKLSYYKHIPAFDLVIGTGVYLDDVEAAVRLKQSVAVEELRHRLRTTHLAKTGYVFIFDGQKNMVIHPNPNIEGTDFSKLLNPSTQTPIGQLLTAVADKQEGLRYLWDSTADPGNYVYDKISWVRYFKEFDWYICTSVNVGELDASARILRNRVLAVFVVTLLLSVLLIYLFVKKLTDPLRQLSDTALRVESGDFDARCNLSRDDEIGVVATAFNGMVRRLQDNIRHLDAKVVERTAELEKTYEELKQLDQLKSDFLSTVSHELRTPLTSIRGSLALIVGGVVGELPAAVKPLVEIAHKNSERLILLVNDILDMEKIEAGKMEFHCKPTELNPLLKQALEGNHAYAEQFNVTYELESELPEVMVNVDANRLMQVFANLLSNAAKFSPRGGKVLVEIKRIGQRIRVMVKDNGSGIPDEFKDRIFQKFAQADSSDTRKKGGTGLGLSITKAIVEKMGGSIGIDSQPDVLTTFFVEFPIWQETVVVASDSMEEGKRKRVLICEDDHDIAALLRLMLEQAGLEADIAYNATQAKQMLAQRSYVAMTLDLALPDQDGIALIRELRAAKQTATLPIVVVSAKAIEGRKELNGEAFSVVDWISKPIDQEQLAAALKQAVGQAPDARPKVLHVEDDPDIFLVVKAIVDEFAEMDNATNLADARRMLENNHYDLAILDISLPDGSGMELLPVLNGASPPIPVMVFSSHEMGPENIQEVKSALVKSRTNNAQLLATIKHLIGVV